MMPLEDRFEHFVTTTPMFGFEEYAHGCKQLNKPMLFNQYQWETEVAAIYKNCANVDALIQVVKAIHGKNNDKNLLFNEFDVVACLFKILSEREVIILLYQHYNQAFHECDLLNDYAMWLEKNHKPK